MAFEITKSTIYRMTAKLGCGCAVTREYEDSRYEKGVGEVEFATCDRHSGKVEASETINGILNEYLETEAKREAAKPATRQVTPDTEVDEHGNIVNKIDVPNKIKPLHRRPALSQAALPPQMPEVVDPGESGDAMDALLASEDPSEHPTTVIPTRTSKS
jgi:hypothetical protein